MPPLQRRGMPDTPWGTQTPRGAGASGLVGSRIVAPEPTYAEVFYNTSNQRYSGYWHDGTKGTTLSDDVPRISDVLAARPTLKKPPRPLQTTARCLLTKAIAAEKEAAMLRAAGKK